MAQHIPSGFQDGFIEIVKEQLEVCQAEVRDFDQEIERKQQELAELRAARGAAAKRAQQLEDLLRGSSTEPERSAVPARSSEPRRPFADADAVVALIRERGEPMHYQNIHRTMVERGYEIGGAGNADTLLSRYFRDLRLTRVARGTYDLAERHRQEPAPEDRPQTTSAGLRRPLGQRLTVPSLPAPPTRGLTSGMTVIEMAAETLRQAGKPLHYREVAERMLRTGAWETTGKTPQDSVVSAIVRHMQDKGHNSLFVRTERGIYGLREWER